MSPADEKKALHAAERGAWALKRIATCFEAMTKGGNRADAPCTRCGSWLLELPKGPASPKTCAVCGLRPGEESPIGEALKGEAEKPEVDALTKVAELAVSMNARLREQFALKGTVVIEVSEDRWPALLAALQATPEWRYSSQHSNRACEVEICGVVFRADLSELYRR